MSNEAELRVEDFSDIEAFEPLDPELDQMIEQVKFGQSITMAISNPVVEMMLNTAKRAYVTAVKAFGDMDLTAPNAIYAAIRLQGEMKRYADMVDWITMIVNAGTEAKEELSRRQSVDQENRGRENYYGSEQRDG